MTEPRDLRRPADSAVSQIRYVADDLPPGVSVPWLCEVLWEAEARFGLLDWEVNGVKPWQAGRFAIFRSLVSKLGLFELQPDEQPRGAFERIAFHGRLLRGALTQNPFASSERYDALVFESSRSESAPGGTFCVYTQGLADELSHHGKRVQLLDSHLHGYHSKSPDRRRRFTDAIALESGLRFRLSRWSARARDLILVKEVEEYLGHRLSIGVRLTWLISPGVPRFLAAHATYRRLLLKRQPRDIFCVGAYAGLGALIAAAKSLAIRTTEVQHGAIDLYHVGYSFPRLPRSGACEYLPDRFLAWKGAWNQIPTLPCQVETVTPYWARGAASPVPPVKRPGSIVVLSQPGTGRRLAMALLDRIGHLRPFEIVVKLHPLELGDPSLRGAFEALGAQPNVWIDRTGNLEALLSTAEYQVGVYSTALYQGIDSGCKTLLVPLPGIEHMTHLLASGRARLLDDFLSFDQPSSLA